MSVSSQDDPEVLRSTSEIHLEEGVEWEGEGEYF